MRQLEVVRANLSHAQQIETIINEFHKESLLLKRTVDEICHDIENFYVVVENGIVLGCCSLYIYNATLAEIRSLAIKKEYQGKKLGGAIVNKIIEEAKRLQIKRLFALTLVPVFFSKLGFATMDRNNLPEKIWNDCYQCPKKDNCPEIALIKYL